ncbi:hypothetical protein [Flagellimonas marinaquae]|uniref:hypothetical protein n=1 Tax=Flagellimonas marinaquae TaxID=254955 RepID=UPI00207537D5|nr:hypothetical protein [Allomuricauda aquimarina]USD24572.1 hypothetical protein MJO53_12910 [Allomuricauda aquimarina]
MTEIDRLKNLCGLSPNDLAEVLENNPRAYMAVKGAVAERHLKDYFKSLQEKKVITSFKEAENDFEKDFYVTLLDGREIIVECKNVEVQKISTKNDLLNYLRYVQLNKGELTQVNLDKSNHFSLKDLKNLFSRLPQNLRESGIPRYEFSASQLSYTSIHDGLNPDNFLNQFNHSKLSIDFQRTRNSRDDSSLESKGKAARFYKLDEIDIVAACLFTRTMKWEFVFGSRKSLVIHPAHNDRFSNRLQLDPKLWSYDFMTAIE